MSTLSNIKKIQLSQLADKIFQGISHSVRTKSGDDESSIPIINVKDIVDGRITDDSLDSVSIDDHKDINRYTVRTNDVVITCRGTLLKSAVVPEGFNGYLITSNLIAIRLRDNFEPLLLSTYFHDPMMQKTLLAHARSSTMQIAFTVSDIGKVEIPLIPLESQKKLSKLISAAETQYNSAIRAATLRREIAYNIALNSFHENIPTVNGGKI